MILGIVGSEEIKFTELGKQRARVIIHELVSDFNVTAISSGHCHLGGIDIWAEEIGQLLHKQCYIFPPKELDWEHYRVRNIQIARKSDKVICITVDEYPKEYKGMKFATCYHCQTNTHIKSGGCWTTKCAERFNKDTDLIVIKNY